jgi:hypothetical protein
MVVLAKLAWIDPPVTGHAEMENEGVAPVGIDKSIFGAAPERDHARSGKPLAKVMRQRTPQIRPTRLDHVDATAHEDSREAADGSLDFGKFGHASSDMAKVVQRR